MRRVLSLLAMTLLFTGRALAGDWANCAQQDDRDLEISGCSNVIASSIIAPGQENPGNLAVAYYNRGAAFAGKYVPAKGTGDLDRAVADYDQAIRLNPDYGYAYYGRGIAHALHGDHVNALIDYRLAAKLIPASDQWHGEALKRIANSDDPLDQVFDALFVGSQPPAAGPVAEPGAVPATPISPAAVASKAQAAFDRGDVATALPLWTSLAQQGNAPAQKKLAIIYGGGLGVPPNFTEAANWYLKLASRGDGEAEDTLGNLYYEGRGVRQDYIEAAKWYRLAADHGFDHAQFHLGILYERGQGVPQDYVSAYMWLNLASAQSGDFRGERELVAKKMTADQMAEAQKRAREWKPE